MTKEEVISFLKENLTIEIQHENKGGYSESKYVETKVIIRINGEEIHHSCDYLDLS